MQLDPTDRDLARKRAREAAEADIAPALVDEYIKANPTLDEDGYPADEVSLAFELLYAQSTEQWGWDEVDADE